MADIAFVALGTNLGDRAAHLAAARVAIASSAGVRLLHASCVEETAPLAAMRQPPYLNQMVAVSTTLEPEALLARLQLIERSLGRLRSVRWGARTIDLDIVRYGLRRLRTAALELPHPGFAHRAFWQRESAQLDRLLAAA